MVKVFETIKALDPSLRGWCTEAQTEVLKHSPLTVVHSAMWRISELLVKHAVAEPLF